MHTVRLSVAGLPCVIETETDNMFTKLLLLERIPECPDLAIPLRRKKIRNEVVVGKVWVLEAFDECKMEGAVFEPELVTGFQVCFRRVPECVPSGVGAQINVSTMQPPISFPLEIDADSTHSSHSFVSP